MKISEPEALKKDLLPLKKILRCYKLITVGQDTRKGDESISHIS